MSSSLIVVNKIVEYIVGTVGHHARHHAGFLLHYKQNLKNLEEEMIDLQDKSSRVQEKVDEANRRGEAVENNVSVWLKDADETRQGVQEFMAEKIAKENMLCFNFSCPNLISRYRLSKQAEKVAIRIKHLTVNGSKIGTSSHPSSGDYEDFHSRQKVFEGIVKALKDSKVNMIGVYGTGGIGKTTMVKKVGKLLKEDRTFDEVVMAVVSQDANVRKIQAQLADRLNLTLSGETVVGRATQLWNRLDNGKKNLIILDDVWHELNLTEIGIPITDGKKICKVVVTSRKRDVLRDMDVDHKDFEIESLPQEEAWALFTKKMGYYVDSLDQPRLREIAWEICEECKGLPVAINAVVAALKGKDMDAWQNALNELKNSMLHNEGIDGRLFKTIKLSYDLLASEDAKLCFLLCCLFPEDVQIQIDDLVRYYMAGSFSHRSQMPDTLQKTLNRVRKAVEILKSHNLLLDGNGEFLVEMHYFVRDVAISIAEDEKSFLVKHNFKDWPDKAAYEHCSVISLMSDDVRKFPDKLVCPELHTLRLDCTINGSLLQVSNEFFSGMGKLMVLDLKRVIMSPRLPTSLAKLAKLQMLCLNRCKLGDIAILKDLKDHLEILSLRGSNINVLSPEVGKLTRLRLLDMTDCDELRMIPKGVISKLCRLEELYMPMSFGEWEGTTNEREKSSVSLDELMLLTQLTTLHIWIPNAELLPKDLTFANQVRFRILVGGKRFDYADLYFRHENFGSTRASTGVLRLENFHVENTLEFLLGNPKRSGPGNGLYGSMFIIHLTDLYVTDCRLKYLFSPSCARGLGQLQCLAIQHCGVMEGVIGTEGDKDEDSPIIFSGLKFLHLQNLPNLISFYPKKEKIAISSGSSSGHAQTVLFNDKVTFPALERLEIDSVDKITKIWDKQMLPIQEIATKSSFCELSELEICACNKLMNVVGGCPKRETIVMENQEEKEVDHYHVTQFPKLKILRLVYLQNLESFCSSSMRCEVLPLFDHQVAFPALEELRITTLPNITVLIDIRDKKLRPAESFCPLRDLHVYDCGKLVNVVRSNMLPQLQNLKNLSLISCPMMEVIIDLEKNEEETQEAANNTIVLFPKLTYMNLRSLQNIKSFCIFRSGEQPVFNPQVEFPKLKYLSLYTLGGTADLQQLLGVCKLSSKHLELKGCNEVSTLVSPHSLGSLLNVGLLTVEYCERVREVFHFDGLEVGDGQECVGPSLVRVRMVELNYLPQLTCLWKKNPHRFLGIQNLEYLTIKSCPLLANLLTASVAKALVGLKVLYLRSCSTMEEVITTDEEGHKDVTEIVFPKLEHLILKDLSNLKSFCSSNHNLKFPSLQRVILKRCPKVQTFTSGSVRMPQILLITRGNNAVEIEDLNKYLEQRHLKGDQEIIEDHEMFGDEDWYRNLQHLE